MKKFFELFWSYLSFALVLIGIGGIAWHTFSDDGWGERLIGVVWDAEMRHPLIVTPIILGTLFVAYMFLRRGATAERSRFAGNVLVWGMSLSGAYFVLQWIRATL